ncbi:TRAP-type C4-dicarboxylate transport system, large permease component [Nitrincola lacisaponensis]|uniref:TRAP transporter large permease protein n=1 Tax=Nitrincola lacisaponensis TaxID=267850 RepID=A0A063Y3H5_9GAMM|nr:TRAP transporter large permease subunit [Nitrincola lacisaponensis]KDE39047.1 TRAP-type C4-dicarboxylate transport system, large permease component [Nitrincola lacisaponensis]
MEILPFLMFLFLFGFILLGLPVAFSLTLVAAGAGYILFQDMFLMQLYRQVVKVSSDFILASIPLFILMGAILERAGIAMRLFNAFQTLTARLPGGVGVASLAMCGVFAAATGVVGAVEIVVGIMAIPAMQKLKYNNSLIAGTVCAGGSLGTIIPPSVIAIVYAALAQMSVGQLFAAAMFPGLIMLGLFILYIMIYSYFQSSSSKNTDAQKTDTVHKTTWELIKIVSVGLLPATFLIITVLGSLLAGIASPTEAAAVGVGGAFLLMFAYGEFSIKKLIDALDTTIRITAMIMLIVVAGTMFTGIFIVAGGASMVRELVSFMGDETWQVILVMLVIVFIIGFVMDWISIVLICVPIFMPIVRSFGIDPIWFAVMMMVVIQTSYLTPPMAPSIFYLKSIAPKDMTYGQMCRGVIPFVIIQFIVLIIVAAFPLVATWLPGQLSAKF